MDRKALSAAFPVTVPVLMGYLAIGIAFGYDRLVLKKKKTVYTIIGYGPSAAH